MSMYKYEKSEYEVRVCVWNKKKVKREREKNM